MSAQGAMAARRPLARATLGINHILWANDDLPELTPPIEPYRILDEMARLGYKGCQLGRTFPRGDELREALRVRGLRIAEVYAAIECTIDGPVPGALENGRARLAELNAAHGDVLVAALSLSPDRVALGGRASAAVVPRLSDQGLVRLAQLLETLAAEAQAAGRRLAFHHHVGTYVETPDELKRLMTATDPGLVGLCLDTGHWLLGGGDPVAAIKYYGQRVSHIHLKDLDQLVAARMRAGEIAGFLDGLRSRVFTEIGSGALDLAGVLEALAIRDYSGWLIVEQDTTWRPPSESAAISQAIVAYALRELAGGWWSAQTQRGRPVDPHVRRTT